MSLRTGCWLNERVRATPTSVDTGSTFSVSRPLGIVCTHQGARNAGEVGTLEKEAWEKAAFSVTHCVVMCAVIECSKTRFQHRCVVDYTI